MFERHLRHIIQEAILRDHCPAIHQGRHDRPEPD
jgi:hypothetical protein